MRGRGLKQEIDPDMSLQLRSPPMRGRGLKQAPIEHDPYAVLSPPMRGRGLKHGLDPKISAGDGVAPHAGAWIETHQDHS